MKCFVLGTIDENIRATPNTKWCVSPSPSKVSNAARRNIFEGLSPGSTPLTSVMPSRSPPVMPPRGPLMMPPPPRGVHPHHDYQNHGYGYQNHAYSHGYSQEEYILPENNFYQNWNETPSNQCGQNASIDNLISL